ncbi:MAG TPA: trigger factor, partial [Longimicrobiaceae bacterium]|nr:trigger factor [Longimicrobiaceae bacterium]
ALPWGFESPLSHHDLHRTLYFDFARIRMANSELKVAVQEPKSWSRRMSITVPRERVERTRSAVTAQIARNVRLPGFRKGHVPQRVLEKQFGASIEQETLERLIQESYREALELEGLRPITQGTIDHVHFHDNAELHFEVEFEVQPEVKLARTTGFRVTRPSQEVGDDEVDSVLERLGNERAVWQPRVEGERPDWGDQVLVEITPLPEEGEEQEEAKTYRFVLGEGQAIPAIEESIQTLAPGEESAFDVTFPEDYHDPEQAGKEQRLHIKLVSAQRKEVPELDDEFARSLGDFEDLTALRARIVEDLREEAKRNAEAEVRGQLVSQILEANPFDVPDSMVERYLDYMTGQTEEERGKLTDEQREQISQWRQTLRPQAEAGLKRMMVVERIAEAEGLRATQDEIDARVEELAQQHGRSPGDVWLQLEKTGQLQALESEITENKVFEHLKSTNTVS